MHSLVNMHDESCTHYIIIVYIVSMMHSLVNMHDESCAH